MVLENVSDHETAAGAFGKRREIARLRYVKCNWFLDKDVLARFQRSPSQRMMARGLGDDGDALDRRAGQHLLKRERAPTVPGDQRLNRLLMRIDDPAQGVKIRKISDEVLAPGSAADHSDAHIQ